MTSPRSHAIRAMLWDDIPAVLQVAAESGSCWIRPDFRTVFQSNETLGFAALEREQIVGFALCTVERCGGLRNRIAWWRRLKSLLGGASAARPRRIRLFSLAASREATEGGLERALLEHFERSLRAPTDQLEAVVPETDVAALEFLREAGFVAARVLSGYYCHIDGYLMTRDNGRELAAEDCQDEPSPITMRRRGIRPR